MTDPSTPERDALLSLDPELAVALDVLRERFSPVKPYRYEWTFVDRWWPQAKQAGVDIGEPHEGATLWQVRREAAPRQRQVAYLWMPREIRGDAWEGLCEEVFALLESP